MKPTARTAAALLALALVAAAGCATNRVTKETNFNYYSEQGDMELGTETIQAQLAEMNAQNVPVDVDKAGLAVLQDMVKRIAEVTEYPEYPWEVHLAEMPVVNAWCAPGGKIMVYRGLFDPQKGLVKTADELGGVLGHEIAHATCRHVTRQRSRAFTLIGALVLPYLAVAVIAPNFIGAFEAVAVGGINLYIPSYSRDSEREADKVGLLYAAKAGYDPKAMVALWTRAAERSGGAEETSLYSSHPASGERAKNLEEVLPEALVEYEAAKKRLAEKKKKSGK